ncbi:unnamed protein product, partial [marine sediment metagenome]
GYDYLFVKRNIKVDIFQVMYLDTAKSDFVFA